MTRTKKIQNMSLLRLEKRAGKSFAGQKSLVRRKINSAQDAREIGVAMSKNIAKKLNYRISI